MGFSCNNEIFLTEPLQSILHSKGKLSYTNLYAKPFILALLLSGLCVMC